MRTWRGVCPRCCPDGGAIFTVHHGVKICNCCHFEIPLRRIVASGKPTKSQQSVIDRITSWGWKVETKMIGRKVFIRGDHPGRNYILGDHICGKISVNGKFKIELSRIGGDSVLTDDIALEVYLK